MIVIMSKRLPLKFRALNLDTIEVPMHYSQLCYGAKGDEWALWSEWPLCSSCVWANCCDIWYSLFSDGGRHAPVYTWIKFQCSVITLTIRGTIIDQHYLFYFQKSYFQKSEIQYLVTYLVPYSKIFTSQYLAYKLIKTQFSKKNTISFLY